MRFERQILAKVIVFIFCLFLAFPASAEKITLTPEALAAIRLKAEKGDPAAIMSLAETYHHCRGVPCNNYQEALKWYLKAAEQGNPEAAFQAGYIYSHDHGASQKRDPKKSVELWHQAAKLGHVRAQLALGNFYYGVHKGTSPDYVEALKWYSEAAKKSDASTHGVFAQESIAGMHLRGEGVERDAAEAFRLFRDAADKGGVVSLGALCTMYERGEGVTQDYVEAYFWCSLYLQSLGEFLTDPSGETYDAHRKAEKKLDATQIEAVQKRLENFKFEKRKD